LVMKTAKLGQKTRALIEKAVADHLDGHDVKITRLFTELEDDGNECIWLGLRYALSARPVDPAVSVDMLWAVNNALSKSGDSRMVYIEREFHDQQPIKGFELAS
jgi:hypothetical protein